VLFQALAGRLPTLNVFTRAKEESKVEKVCTCMLLAEATCTAFEPSVVTTGYIQPPLLSYQFSKILEDFESNHYL